MSMVRTPHKLYRGEGVWGYKAHVEMHSVPENKSIRAHPSRCANPAPKLARRFPTQTAALPCCSILHSRAHVHIYVSARTHRHTTTQPHTRTCARSINKYMHTHARTHTHTCTHRSKHRSHTHTCAHTCHPCIHIHTHAHTHTHTHTHTRPPPVPRCVCAVPPRMPCTAPAPPSALQQLHVHCGAPAGLQSWCTCLPGTGIRTA